MFFSDILKFPYLAALLTIFLLIFSSKTQAAVVFSGVAAGDATDTSAILCTRTADSVSQKGTTSNLTVQVSRDPKFHKIIYSLKGVTRPDHDHTLKLDIKNLKSGTRYYYRFLTGDGRLSPVGTFKTAPAKTQKAAVRFGFSGDADSQWRPYPSTQGS